MKTVLVILLTSGAVAQQPQGVGGVSITPTFRVVDAPLVTSAESIRKAAGKWQCPAPIKKTDVDLINAALSVDIKGFAAFLARPMLAGRPKVKVKSRPVPNQPYLLEFDLYDPDSKRHVTLIYGGPRGCVEPRLNS